MTTRKTDRPLQRNIKSAHTVSFPTLGTYTTSRDTTMLSIIRVYIEDYQLFLNAPEATSPNFSAPDWIGVVRRALDNIGRPIFDPDQLRAQAQTLRRRWLEEIESEHNPAAEGDGVPQTNRYRRVLLAKLLGNGNVPLGFGSLQLYLEKVAGEN